MYQPGQTVRQNLLVWPPKNFSTSLSHNSTSFVLQMMNLDFGHLRNDPGKCTLSSISFDI